MSKQSAYTVERPPIVVVMGHVDHGKSTLLDFIRKSNTVEKETGGITQHVAAYEVTHTPQTNAERTSNNADKIQHASASGQRASALSDLPAKAPASAGGKRITFIDTPGHAAFQSIRARGANVADIAILVVAADDGVKAQTLEALASIKEAEIPFIVAFNKIDKPNANVERAQASLMEQGVYLEKLGGDVPWAAISAKNGTGVDELLDLILLVAELHEFKADADIPAEGYIIEAHRDSKRGLAATLIITNGTLKSGMTVLAGRAVSPVRLMEDQTRKPLREATFSTPVSLVGFDDLPSVGASFRSFRGKREAESARSVAPPPRRAVAPEEPGESEHFALPVIIRADTSGSLEAIAHEAAKLGDIRSSVHIVLSGIGNITENDIKTAVASKVPATVIGFNVAVERIAKERARQSAINVETFDIIYKLAERLQELLRNTRPKHAVEELLGKAKVLRQFSSRKESHVVGGSVQEGHLSKSASVRVVRRGTVMGTGKIKNMQSNKQNVDRVETGSEFGAQIESPFEIARGDTLECFTTTMQ